MESNCKRSFNSGNNTGHISLNFLNEWQITAKVIEKPGYGFKQALIDIFCLFDRQNVRSAYVETWAREYKYDRPKFNYNAKKYTQQYSQKSLFL